MCIRDRSNASILDKEVHAEDEIELNAILKCVLAADPTRWQRVAAVSYTHLIYRDVYCLRNPGNNT